MNQERHRILTMVSEGKVSASEAEALLDALGKPEQVPAASSEIVASPRYLRVVVEGHEGPHGNKVNVRVPFNLIRAGMRLAALLPAAAHGPVNKALADQGINIDVSKIKPEDLEGLVQHLTELSVDVQSNTGEKVRVFCE